MQEYQKPLSIEKANLYVEKYANGELLLDFIDKNEFLYFRYRGDYSPQMNVSFYLQSQILIHNVYSFKAKEKDIFSFSMKELFCLMQFEILQNLEEEFSNIMLELENNDSIMSVLNNGRKLKYREIKKFEQIIKGTWQEGRPCALDELDNDVQVYVLDVGQGSTNFIRDKTKLTIFDFGTSIYAKSYDMKKIIDDHSFYFKNARTISLIISHWDCDHYNLLTRADDNFLKNLCCVFVPDKVISLTAKSVVNRLEKNCYYIRTLSSPKRKKSGTVGMQIVLNQHNYDLFIGEKTADINNSGLSLTVYGKNATMMLTADHSNEQVWKYMYPQIGNRGNSSYVNLTMPHHGGNCGNIKLSKKLSNAGVAVVSVGKNTYKHPTQKSLDAYESLGFKIRRTDWEREDIIIRL